jgi:F0F1-type ATP synthase membrane subunit c/vacuolar-type H+-ATPase subunit K
VSPSSIDSGRFAAGLLIGLAALGARLAIGERKLLLE